MMTTLKRLSPPVLCALAAMLGGLGGGTAAVHGLHQNSYGPAGSAAAFVTAARGPSYASEREAAPAPGNVACDSCSERDMGYRWAVVSAIQSSDQCPNDSWGFRRGCLDYTGGV